MIQYSEKSIKGQFPLNEDRLQVKKLSDDNILAVMADGMGGLDHGEIAANIAVHVIISSLETNTIITEADIIKALYSADVAIEEESRLRGMKMGCAIAIVSIQHNQMLFLGLGNIRISFCDEQGAITNTVTKDSTFTDFRGVPISQIVSVEKDFVKYQP